ncbi:MAG TPA: HD domain-containing protein [Candidatus Thermoplasmatota archaeon]|nr:HD domain-containing protein [Candidatus Thermoplasmatota archaeon]
MKKIRDPIHNYIEVDDAALAVINTPRFQRLRRVHQLGTANLVYPGANHSRFEHSLGAYHLARLAGRALGVPADEALDLALAALLHDVGHGPLSHLTDRILRESFGHEHVGISRALVLGEPFRDALAARGADPVRVADLLVGKGRLGELIAGAIDVDRMDYLVRDGHYTGVNIGVDLHRLVHEFRLTRDGLALHVSGLAAAEMLLTTRFMMYTTVYFHPTCRIAEGMQERALMLAVEAGEIEPRALPTLDDAEVLVALRRSATPARGLQEALDRRDLMKLASAFAADEIAPEALGPLVDHPAAAARAEAAIASRAGVPPHAVIVDAAEPPVAAPPDVRVVDDDGNVTSLADASHLVAHLGEAQRDHWRLRVFAWAADRPRVARAARDVLARGQGLKAGSL